MEEIYEEYSKLVYNYLYSLCHDRNIAEEITQETFYRAVKGIKKFRNDCKVSVWLCQIAKNAWRDYLKKEKKTNVVSLEDDYINNLVIQDDDNTKEEIMTLYKQIHKLDDNTKEVFLLRIKGELSFKEIGEILGKSEGWARNIYYRGKIKLKEEFENDEK